MEALEMDDLSPIPLATPLTIIRGARDNVVADSHSANWTMWNRGKVQYEVVDADHFSYRTTPQPYLKVIAKRLFAQER